MKLKLQRSQRTTGFRGIPVFQLHAIADVTPEERAMIGRYGLGNNIVYASEQWQNNTAIAQAGGTGKVGFLRGIAAAAAAGLSLKITVNDLINGKQVECKSLDELLGTEDAVITGCQTLKTYLEAAATFDGREILIDI
jgi:hypothetical protein